MSNLARYVQHALEADETCTSIPRYTWCLNLVREMMPALSGKPADERKAALLAEAKKRRRAHER